MVVPTCNPSTKDTEAGRFRAPGQPGLHSKTLSPKTKQNNPKPLLGSSWATDTARQASSGGHLLGPTAVLCITILDLEM
jgi:hypothetical protein